MAAVFVPILALIAHATASGGTDAMPTDKIPIVFSPRYDMGVLGIERFHPFDAGKPGRVHRLLVEGGIDPGRFFIPEKVSDKDLLLVHTPGYLSSLGRSAAVATIAELPVAALIPNAFLRRGLLDPMRYATGGTVLGANLALRYGWAINLSGGYHHAKADTGGGFCFFADIPVAVNKLWEDKAELKVLVVDLDAHQGNGTASILSGDGRVHLFDIYNRDIYPRDGEARRHVAYDHPVGSGTGDAEYLALLRRELPRAVEETDPDLIIYNAGTDIFERDPLGGMAVTDRGIIARDEFVFRTAIGRHIPILMVLSGGYTMESAGIIARSIGNLIGKVLSPDTTGRAGGGN